MDIEHQYDPLLQEVAGPGADAPGGVVSDDPWMCGPVYSEMFDVSDLDPACVLPPDDPWSGGGCAGVGERLDDVDFAVALLGGDPVEAALALLESQPAAALKTVKKLSQEAARGLLAGANRGEKGVRYGAPVSEAGRRELVEAAKAAGEASSVLRAAQQVAVARYAAIDLETVNGDIGECQYVEKPLGHRAVFCDVEVGVACGWSARSAAGRVDQAISTLTRAPVVFRQVIDGEVELWRANLVAGETSCASPQTAALVETDLLRTRGWATWGYEKLRRTVRGLIARHDADAVKQQRERTVRSETNVVIQPSLIAGLAELHATGPVDQIARIAGAIDQLAGKRAAQEQREFPRERRSTQGQLRLQALHDLVTDGAEIGYDVTIQVPVLRGTGAPGVECASGGADRDLRPTPAPAARPDAPRGPGLVDGRLPGTGCTEPDDLATGIARAGRPESGDSDGLSAPNATTTGSHPDADSPPTTPGVGWASVPGVGLIEHDVVQTLLGYSGTRLTRVFLDARTGVTVETTRVTYAPSVAMRRFVQERDGTCRAPGCSRKATDCELDHVIPYPAGKTTPANLASLCKKHHQAKTDRRISYVMDDQGVCTWTTPTGHTAVTHPAAADRAATC